MKFPLFSALFRRSPPTRVWDQLTSNQIQQFITPVVEQALVPLGFEQQKPLHWVASGTAPIRRMFCFDYWKGAGISPSWGFSLDYVPHVSGSQVKWHRTVKTALRDLRCDAREPEMHMCYGLGADKFLEEMSCAIPLGIKKALELWEPVTSIADMPAAFEKTKAYYPTYKYGMGFYGFVQHPIAYAFTLGERPPAESRWLQITA